MKTHTHTFVLPGAHASLHFERAESGQLMRLSGSGRVYFQQRAYDRVLDDGFVTVSEILLNGKLLRQVRTLRDFWIEEYHWDHQDRLVWVDGVQVERDERNRVTACLTPEGEWRYGYAEDFLVRIESPIEVRRLRRGEDGRVLRVRSSRGIQEIPYDSQGRRLDAPQVPFNYHRDSLGRLWTITDDAGKVLTTYLWDGYACLGRIDGPLGEPLQAAFSLDPTCTPVRVITRDQVHRLSRDAFGERLLAWEGVPGLFGGTLYGGFCHYVSRALDPLCAAFHAPDPLHGLEDDPRRAAGYRGPLMVEHPAAGPYAVCQHDPISRTDPTGEFSVWVLLSDLTWSLQNNIVGWLGVDFVFNFWGSLFTAWTGSFGRFFDRSGLYSERAGTWGVRSDGVIGLITGGRAFAFQHQVWSPSQDFDELSDARVFDPQGDFRPILCGTLLRAAPQDATPFLLRGDANLTAGAPLGWTRAGGVAEPVVPGSLAPYFPSGGLHLDTTQVGLRGPRNCTVTELETEGSLSSGTVNNRIIIDAPARGLGLSSESLVLLSDATSNVFIQDIAAAVEEGSGARIYLKIDLPGLGPNNVRLRGLGAALSTENLTHNAATPVQYLNALGSTGAYTRGDPLRLSQGGSPVGAALIDRFEARLQIDAPVAGLNTPIAISTAQALGAANAATLAGDAQTLDSPANPPNVNDVLVISNASRTDSLAVIVIERTGNQWRVDRPVQPLLGAAGANINWRRLTVSLPPVGTKEDALEAGAVLTYRAEAPRTAPTTNFVQLRDRDGKLAARAVTALTYDAIVLGTPLPGNAANAYSVERFPVQAPDLNNLTVTRAQALVLNPPLSQDAVAVQYYQFPGATMTTGAAVQVTPAGGVAANATFTVNASSTSAGFIIPAGATMSGLGALRPAQVIGVQPAGGNVIPALVKNVKLSVTLDRNLPLSGNDLQVAPLTPTGPVYNSTAQAPPAGSGVAAVITVRPETTIGGTVERIQMPRFQPGELVLASWGGGGANTRRYRIGAPAGSPVPPVDGTTLGLLNDDPLPVPFPADLTVQRLEPTSPNPATGSSRIAIRGAPSAAGGTNRATFEVWSADGLPSNRSLGIVDPSANLTFPARINSIDTIACEFTALITVPPGNVTILPATPDVRGAAASFTRDRGAVIIPGNTLRVGSDLILVVPFKNSTRSASGSLSGGTVVVPDDANDGELTRVDSLTAHELTHTRQWAAFGPWMLFTFPTFIVEGIVEATTEVEMPEFSPYVAGTLVREGGTRFLQIPDPQGVGFNPNDHVQLSWSASQPGSSGPVAVSGAGVPHSLTLGARQQPNKFQITVGPDIVPIEVVNVQVRRERSNTAWRTVLDIAHQLSAGGILNQVAGFVYGGLFTLIGRGIYALIRLIGGQGKNYPAAVEGSGDETGKLLRLGDAAGRSALGGASRIIIQANNKTLVRNVERINGDVIRLTQAVSLTGGVRVAPYETHTPDSYWDWRNYFPASIPDPSRPTALRVEPVGEDRLTLQSFDRVAIAVGDQSFHRTVTAVAGDGTVEVNEAPPLSGEPVFRIAKIGEDDPIGNVDNASLIELYGMGWMRWLFDPYGQLHFRTRPTPGSFWDVVARIARYAFSSQSWSFIWASVLTIDRVHQAEHLARIEQEASSESGDTYSPLGRLRGEVRVVGDIARYWQVPIGGTRNTDTMVAPGMQDAPGVWLTDTPRVIPSMVTGVVAAADPNGTAGISAGIADPGRDVADVFFAKTTTTSSNPLTAKATGPDGFQPSVRGWAPTSAIMQRSSGVYVAFSRPGTHRVTIRNGVTGSQEAREAQDAGRQTLWFDVNVQPVVVSVNGQTVNDGDIVRLVLRQQATVSVSINGARRYAATVLQQTRGSVLRAPDVNNPLVIAAQDQVGTEAVEVSRFYRFDAATRTYDDAVLQRHGVHVPTDIHIPVRSFNLEVTNTLPVRNALSLDPVNEITTLSPNQDAFILVPVAIGPRGLQITSATVSATGAALNDAERNTLRGALLQPPPASLPENIRAFIGADGGVIQLRYTPAITLPSQTVLQMTVQIGAVEPRVTLNVTLTLTP